MSWTYTVQRLIQRVQRTLASSRSRLRVEELESREVPAGVAFDFDTTTSPTQSGFTHLNLVNYSATNRAGWQTTTGMSAVNRTYSDSLRRDFHTGKDSTFLADLTNGTYDVVVGLGDHSAKRDFVSVWAEGTSLTAPATTQVNEFLGGARPRNRDGWTIELAGGRRRRIDGLVRRNLD